MARIYLSPPHLTGEEQELVADAFASNWIAPLGPHVDAFERELSAVVGVPHAVALSSGTAAIHLALKLVGVEPGDEVICSTMTFSASANPIVYEGGRPVFVDSEPDSWNMDPALLEEELHECARRGRLPKAAIVVDLYGQSADWDRITAVCDAFGVPVIEDAAEALGASYRGRPLGGFGRMGIFSFNGNKIITTSGGGMLVSDDPGLVDRARFLATQAREPVPHYEHVAVGYNYRLSNILAAIGRGQLRTLAERVRARRRVFDAYVALLGDLPGIAFMPEASWGRATRWLTCLTLDADVAGVTRDEVLAALAGHDIEARPLWKPMHLQPVFSTSRCRGGSIATALFNTGLCLPSGSSLTPADVERVAGVVRAAWLRR